MPRQRRLRAMLAVSAATLALAACTSPGGSDVEPAPATLAWAGEVCSEVADVRTSIGAVGDGLVLNPLDGTDGLAKARAQVDSRIAEVQRSFDELRARIAAAPDDPPAQEAKATLEAALTAVETAADTAGSNARQALQSDSVAAAISAAGGSLGALRDAVVGVGDLVGAVTGTASDTSVEVKAAFEQAPQCQDLN